MCGIIGILDTIGILNTKKFKVPNENDILKHRGPDGFGYYLDSKIYLGHRRLSIIDLESGRQPIYNEDKTKCIIFNGEIYNFREVRINLEAKGHNFTTNSDTEVIIHAYEEWGDVCVERFCGMFAFAIWDNKNEELFLARDRMGIKPLFYAFYEGIFYFASEIKGILQYQFFPREIDINGFAAYFMLSYIPAPMTIFKHIRKVPPGHTLKLKDGQIKINEYWDLYFNPDRSKTEGYFIDGITHHLDEAVSLTMVSDVPIGAFLSGGIDSGAVVAAMSRLGSEPVRTFSIGFGGNVGGYLDERGYAQQIAGQVGAIHADYEVLPDFHNILEDIVRSFDEPFADTSTIPSYYVSKMARANVKVALSGLGGDELFGGYERYLGFKVSSFYNRLPLFIREKVIRQIVEGIPERADGHYTINHLKRFVRATSLSQDMRYLNFMTILGKGRTESLFSESGKYTDGFDYCQKLILNYFNTSNATEPLDRVFYCDIKTYLPEDILACTDRMSMLHSLEVRVPFLEHKLVEFCATIPSEMKIRLLDKKHIFKKALLKVLPKEVLTHRKQGFVGPMTVWLQTDLRTYVLDVLSEKNLDRHGIFNKNTVKTILDEHFNHVEINDKLIWTLVMFQNWYNNYMS